MSDTRHDPGQQFVVDAFTHHSVGHSGYVYAHLFTDLASRQVYPVFTKSKLVSELTTNMSELFYAHPDWKPNGSVIDRKIKVDLEAGYQSAEFREFCHTLRYLIESSPTKDKHAHEVTERSVGNIVTKANIAMLGNITQPCPQTFGPDAILYACHCDGFGNKHKIGISQSTAHSPQAPAPFLGPCLLHGTSTREKTRQAHNHVQYVKYKVASSSLKGFVCMCVCIASYNIL